MSTDDWFLRERDFDINNNLAYEGLFTVGNGTCHIRGSIEEHFENIRQNVDFERKPTNTTAEKFKDQFAKWGTYMPGFYGNHPWQKRELANLPWFLGIELYAENERLDLRYANIVDYERVLDMEKAILYRTFTWITESGCELQLEFERFAHILQKDLVIQRLSITSSRDVTVEIVSVLDTDVRTNGHDHYIDVEINQLTDSSTRCYIETDADCKLELVTETKISSNTDNDCDITKRQARQRYTVNLTANETQYIEKRTRLTLLSQEQRSDQSSAINLYEKSFSDLKQSHCDKWFQYWESADILIEGHSSDQLGIRFSIYHLLRSHPRTGDYSIGAKGFSGDAYRGNFFWDTEIYMLPFFLYTQPHLAKNLLDYRIKTLPGAKENAKRYGHNGARYAWVADNNGNEQGSNWQYPDHEIHITADIIYAMAHYVSATNDIDYWQSHAQDVLKETAIFWLERIDWRDSEDTPSLLGVMGPDEYNPIVNNNTFTNVMVKYALSMTAQHLTSNDEEFKTQCREIAKNLPITRSHDGKLVCQDESFETLAPLDFDKYWLNRSKPIASQVPQDRIYRSQCIKQADVMLTMMLFPDEFSIEDMAYAWDYYLPRTSHDSSLSYGVHSIIANRLNKRQEAYEFWRKSLMIDLDIGRGKSAQGIHIASAGINWQAAIFGFGGLRYALDADELSITPNLPDNWTRIAFQITWHGVPIDIDISKNTINLQNKGKHTVKTRILDTHYMLKPNTPIEVNL